MIRHSQSSNYRNSPPPVMEDIDESASNHHLSSNYSRRYVSHRRYNNLNQSNRNRNSTGNSSSQNHYQKTSSSHQHYNHQRRNKIHHGNNNNEELPPRFAKNRNQNNSTASIPGPSRFSSTIMSNSNFSDSKRFTNNKRSVNHPQTNKQSDITESLEQLNLNVNSVPQTNNLETADLQCSQDTNTIQNDLKNLNNMKNRKWNKKGKVRSEFESQREIMDELLRKAKYECIVCCEMIKVHNKTWNCPSCYNVFHLKCIQQWARKSSVNPAETTPSTNPSTSTNLTNYLLDPNISSRSSGGQCSRKSEAEWRCPTCQDIQRVFPEYYYCFCGKNKEPESSNYRVPHSCGEPCSRNLNQFNPKLDNEEYFDCKHRCTLMCHPGKCPPCTSKVERTCACQKTKLYLNCSSKRSDVRCQQICNKILNCFNHRCQRICHFGDCDPCDKRFELKCFCGKVTREAVNCNEFKSGFSCDQICSKQYRCGTHKCQKICHLGNCGNCPFSPEMVSYCNCGKTRIADIANSKPRTSCTDPIPTCGKICEKIFPCGNENDKPHRCKLLCHNGDCNPCDSTTIIRCYCRANSQKINCKDIISKHFQCKRKCNKKLSCGRHKCLKECCIDKEHICRQTCGRKLVCGQHTCAEQCHQVCRSCPNVIWTEITCNCGAELLYPPLPCGTQKPPCKRPCSRRHRCEHPPKHPCHDDPECPPCIEFVSRLCYGGHEVRNSILCYETGISCGKFCQKALPCGVHKCSKVCHDGDCPKCTQKCLKIRSECQHYCGLPCHQSTINNICPESPCKEKITISCECEFKRKEVECNEVFDPRRFQQQLDNVVRRFSFNASMTLDEMKEMVRHNIFHSLTCDQECVREKRNKNMAEALGISSNGQPAINFVKYSEQLKNDARSNPHFIMTIHDKFVQLIDVFKQSNKKSMCYNFKAMNKECRRTIHDYATHFGIKTESIDQEPNRSIIITANKQSSVPKITLLESVNIDVKELRPKKSVVKYKTASEENKNKKTINYFDD